MTLTIKGDLKNFPCEQYAYKKRIVKIMSTKLYILSHLSSYTINV